MEGESENDPISFKPTNMTVIRRMAGVPGGEGGEGGGDAMAMSEAEVQGGGGGGGGELEHTVGINLIRQNPQ